MSSAASAHSSVGHAWIHPCLLRDPPSTTGDSGSQHWAAVKVSAPVIAAGRFPWCKCRRYVRCALRSRTARSSAKGAEGARFIGNAQPAFLSVYRLCPCTSSAGSPVLQVLANSRPSLSGVPNFARLISVLSCSVRVCPGLTLGTGRVSPFSYIYSPFDFPHFRSIHLNMVPIFLLGFP